jgi:hypothetical protein
VLTDQPGPSFIPVTPLLEYFQSALFKEARGPGWVETRTAELQRWLSDPDELATLFAESVAIFEDGYRNYQPFYPTEHRFGDVKGVPHGTNLKSTVDVAARLARQETSAVAAGPSTHGQLDVRYLDREIELARAKPAPNKPIGAVKSALVADLFLANAHDRTPILCEVKVANDQCAFYALIQLLTQATYASTRTQRERLVLFGSQPEFVLREAVPHQHATIDLYIMLVNPPGGPRARICELAIELSNQLLDNERVAARIGRIAWLEGRDDGNRGLSLRAISAKTSQNRRPR